MMPGNVAHSNRRGVRNLSCIDDYEAFEAAGMGGDLVNSLDRGLGERAAARDPHRMAADGSAHSLAGRLANRLCCVDAIVKRNGRIRLVVEIDESNVKPTHLAGKWLTTALAKCYIPERKGKPVSKAKNVWFLQIVSTKGLKSNSKKPAQWRGIERAIQAIPVLDSMQNYGLFAGEKADFKPEGKLYQSVAEFVARALAG